MSIECLNHVWEKSPSKGAARLVLLCLADYADFQGNCFPSITKVAARCQLSERAVQTALRSLEDAGELTRVGRSGHSSVYHVTRSVTPAESAPPPPQNLHPTPAESAPITTKEPPVEPPQDGGDLFGKVINLPEADRFEEFWQAYPRHVAKAAARKNWAKAIRKTNPQVIIDGARSYADWCERDRTPADKIKYPQGWLTDERWTDELPARAAAAQAWGPAQ